MTVILDIDERVRAYKRTGRWPTVRLGLVGCGAKKARHACAAADMYTSTLFRAARAYAETACTHYYVLSAKHGLLDPATVIEPYEHRLTRDERDAWGEKVGRELDGVLSWPQFADTELVVLAGAEYADHIFFPDAREFHWEEPLRGMGIGQRIAWLKKHTRRSA